MLRNNNFDSSCGCNIHVPIPLTHDCITSIRNLHRVTLPNTEFSALTLTLILTPVVEDKPNTTAQLLPDFSRARTKFWSNYTRDKAYILQHSYTKAPVELEPKNLVKLHNHTSLPTTAELLPYFSKDRTKILSNYTQDKAYILQHR